MKLSIVFAVLATVSSMVAPVASAPLAQERAVEKRASTGKGTWYDVGLGACGKRNNNNQPIIAVNKPQWNKKLCGKWVTVTHTKNKKSARGYIEDMCPGCKKGYLDLSPSIFKKLAPLSAGVIPISWNAPSTKRSDEQSDDDLVIRAGNPDDVEPEEEDPEFKFDPADALTEDELAELLASGDDDSEEAAS